MANFWHKYRLQLILASLGFLLIIISIFGYFLTAKKESSEIEIIPAPSSRGEIYVHLAGAVQRPGLYKLALDSRINDALVSAGGLSAEADRVWFDKNINLAQKLTDGSKLYFPFKGEKPPTSQNSSTVLSQQSGGKINLNTASLNELDTLPGIGPVTSQKIINYREKNGPFTKVEDLLKVPGIGDKLFSQLKDLITL